MIASLKISASSTRYSLIMSTFDTCFNAIWRFFTENYTNHHVYHRRHCNNWPFTQPPVDRLSWLVASTGRNKRTTSHSHGSACSADARVSDRSTPTSSGAISLMKSCIVIITMIHGINDYCNQRGWHADGCTLVVHLGQRVLCVTSIVRVTYAVFIDLWAHDVRDHAQASHKSFMRSMFVCVCVSSGYNVQQILLRLHSVQITKLLRYTD